MDVRVIGSPERIGQGDEADCVYYNLLLTEVPLILAMVLKNESVHDRSAYGSLVFRTNLRLEGREKNLYERWLDIFKKQIKTKFPRLDVETSLKKACENARYFVSVFTPMMTVEYKININQARNLIALLEKSAKSKSKGKFRILLNPLLGKAASLFRRALNLSGSDDCVSQEAPLLARNYQKDFFGGTYSVNYMGSFAFLEQILDFDDIRCEIFIPKLDDEYEPKFFIPPILDDTLLAQEYIDDMESIKDVYPLGMLLYINENGTLEAFLERSSNQMCSLVMPEARRNACDVMCKYLDGVERNSDASYRLEQVAGKAGCQFGFYICEHSCPLGAKGLYDLKI